MKMINFRNKNKSTLQLVTGSYYSRDRGEEELTPNPVKNCQKSWQNILNFIRANPMKLQILLFLLVIIQPQYNALGWGKNRESCPSGSKSGGASTLGSLPMSLRLSRLHRKTPFPTPYSNPRLSCCHECSHCLNKNSAECGIIYQNPAEVQRGGGVAEVNQGSFIDVMPLNAWKIVFQVRFLTHKPQPCRAQTPQTPRNCRLEDGVRRSPCCACRADVV